MIRVRAVKVDGGWQIAMFRLMFGQVVLSKVYERKRDAEVEARALRALLRDY